MQADLSLLDPTELLKRRKTKNYHWEFLNLEPKTISTVQITYLGHTL